MGESGWTSLSLKDSLVARIDAFLAANREGFSNRAEVIATAVRQFIETKEEPPLTRSELDRMLRAVAAAEPTTPAALLEALLAELDQRQGPGELRPGRPHASSSEANRKSSGEASKTDSTKRK